MRNAQISSAHDAWWNCSDQKHFIISHQTLNIRKREREIEIERTHTRAYQYYSVEGTNRTERKKYRIKSESQKNTNTVKKNRKIYFWNWTRRWSEESNKIKPEKKIRHAYTCILRSHWSVAHAVIFIYKRFTTGQSIFFTFAKKTKRSDRTLSELNRKKNSFVYIGRTNAINIRTNINEYIIVRHSDSMI